MGGDGTAVKVNEYHNLDPINKVMSICIDHSLGDLGNISVLAYILYELVNIHFLPLGLSQLVSQQLYLFLVFALLLFITLGHFIKTGIINFAGNIVLIKTLK